MWFVNTCKLRFVGFECEFTKRTVSYDMKSWFGLFPVAVYIFGEKTWNTYNGSYIIDIYVYWQNLHELVLITHFAPKFILWQKVTVFHKWSMAPSIALTVDW